MSSAAPCSYQDLEARLRSRMDSFSAGQRRIGELLLNDPEGTAFRTIGETARRAEVHPSSVVRFARAFGLTGYPGLTKLCRERLAEQAHLVRRFDLAERHVGSEALLSAVVDHDQQNLSRTFSRIDAAAWQRAVAMLTEGASVYVMGIRKCLSVAQLFSYLLHMVRPGVRLVAPPTGELVDVLRDLRRDDVLVGISIRRYSADTVRAMRYAHERGVRTLALTDGPASPLKDLAEVTFDVETDGVTILRSMAAFVSLVQALSTAVAVAAGARSRAELEHDEALLDSFEVYVDSPQAARRRRTPPAGPPAAARSGTVR